MASRVNVRFVTILTGALLALFVVMAATAWFVLRKSAEDQVELGDQAMAAGDYEEAANRYGRAVSKDKANAAYYQKYQDALTQWSPDQDAVYQEAFYQYLGTLERIATLKQTDVDAHHAYLRAQLSLAELGADRAGWENLAAEAERALVNFEYAEQLDEQTARRWPSLRRYRAIAYKELVARGHSITNEETEQTAADFEAALGADPADVQTVIALVHWHAVHAELAADAGRDAEVGPAFQRAREALQRGLAAAPGDPELVLSGIQLEEQERSTSIPRLAPPAERFAQQRQIAEDLAPQFDAIVGQLQSETDPGAISERLMRRLQAAERYFRPEAGNAATVQLLDDAIERDPANASLRLMRGGIEVDYGRFDEAIEHFQKIVDTPRPPVSLEGILLEDYRTEAISRQASAALSKARKLLEEGDTAGAEAAIARAASFRDSLAARVPTGEPAIKLFDAEIAYLRGNPGEANTILTEYTNEAGRNVRSVGLHAEVLQRLNQPGAARDELRRLTELAPRNWRAHFQLGRAEERLQNWTEAEEAFDRAIELAPWNEQIVEARRRMRVTIGRESSEDPIEQAIANATRWAWPMNKQPPQPERARQTLLAAIDAHGDDPRLIQALMRHHLLSGEREAAAQVTLDAAERNPEDEQLAALAQQVRMVLSSPEEQIAAIEAADVDEEIKVARRVEVYSAAGRTEEAERAIEELARINPDNRLVLDYQFRSALQAQDYEAAEQVAARAARANADEVGGLAFRGRLLLERGQDEEAAQALGEALARGSVSIEVRRLLALAQVRLGQTSAAISTLRDAIAARPNDLPTIMQTLNLLISQRQYQEALRLAQASESVGGYDDDFIHLWLDLEARAGDQQVARARREKILQERPEDRRNRLALARLYVDTRNPKAPELIKQLRAEEDSLLAVDLDARWRFAQGRLDEARKIYRDYLAGLEPGHDEAARAWLGFASLLSSAGDTEGAIVVLQDASEALGDRSAQADHALASLYVSLARFHEAAEAYRRVIDSGVDDASGRLRISRAEVLTLAGEGLQALDALDALPAELRDSAPARVVRSDAIRLLGREAEADEMLDDAIARAPSFPGGFLKRGEIALRRYRQEGETSSALLEDAIADLTKSIELDPSHWPAFQVRAEARLMAGNIDGAISDADRAIAVNPSLSNLRLRLLETLLEQERFREANQLADSAARTHSTDLPLLQDIGDRFVRAGRHQQAIDLYTTAWEASRSPTIAGRIAELSIHSDRPDLRRAREILAEPALNIEQNPMLLMLRAQLESKAGRAEQMRSDALASLELVLDKPTALNYWIQQSERLFENPQEWLSFLRSARLDRAPGGWGQAMLGARLAQSKQTIEEGLTLLEQASSEASDTAAAASASRDLGSAYFSLGRHEDAVTAWKRALELEPENPTPANNIAFTLADALGRPADALPYAQSAAEALPNDPTILDTLGVVQTRIGQFNEAAGTLQKALQHAEGSPDRQAPVLLHLAQLEAERGDKGAAENYLTRARDVLGPTPGDIYRDLITMIQDRINQL